jgi:hypothetical protein
MRENVQFELRRSECISHAPPAITVCASSSCARSECNGPPLVHPIHLHTAKVAVHEALLSYAGHAKRPEDVELFFMPVYVSRNLTIGIQLLSPPPPPRS